MQTNLHNFLQNIRQHNRNSLARNIANFEKKNRFANNEKSIEFMRKLKCFVSISTSKQFRAQNQKVLRETFSRFEYVVIFYSWEHFEEENNTKENYCVMFDKKSTLIRDVVFDRNIKFIRYISRDEFKVLSLWINQLSINQVDKTKRLTTMQFMNLIYKHCSFVVDYIWTKIQNMHQLIFLVNLLKNRILNRDYNFKWSIMIKHLDSTTTQSVLVVLLLITRDRWWESVNLSRKSSCEIVDVTTNSTFKQNW